MEFKYIILDAAYMYSRLTINRLGDLQQPVVLRREAGYNKFPIKFHCALGR